ncbi:MAG: tRNA dihydrouridine synthase DusB [Acidobacteriota bacterium]|nr:tRNA dihydrouridine synthase DusB [Acidobacteriota bacterium]
MGICHLAAEYNKDVHKYFDNPMVRQVPEGVRVPAELKIANVSIRPATVLAPMAGVTDTVFRRFIREMGGCGLLMTEFTSADGVVRWRNATAKRYLHFAPDEHPISSQLFGSHADAMADAAKRIQDHGFDMVDLNLGCPAKKVVKCNGGSGLLRDLPAIREIFESVRKAVTIPFTVKIRAGWSERELVYHELARMAEDCGLDAIAIHARTREQGYTGQAQWQWIGEVKSLVKIPVIGNGDIITPEDARAMVAETGCDGVMVGRAAASNPWIFRQIAQFTADGRYEVASREDRYRMIHRYFTMLVEEEFPGALGKMKQFASWFTHGVQGGAKLRKAIYDAREPRHVVESVDVFFAGPVPEEPAPAGTALLDQSS